MIVKTPLGRFLACNPFPRGWTDGLFYREKMRAIHRVAPAAIDANARILEIGGGRSGMASYLYQGANITTLDIPCSVVSNPLLLGATSYARMPGICHFQTGASLS